MSYTITKIPSPMLATSATLAITNAIDVGEYDHLNIVLSNSASVATIVHVLVEQALGAAPTAAGLTPLWIPLNTTSFPYGSAVAASAALALIIQNNPFKYLRVSVRATISMTAGQFVTTVGGKKERP